MAGKATAKPKKVTNGIDKKDPVVSMTYIDDILLRLDQTEDDIDSVLSALDNIDLRVGKVESRLGLG